MILNICRLDLCHILGSSLNHYKDARLPPFIERTNFSTLSDEWKRQGEGRVFVHGWREVGACYLFSNPHNERGSLTTMLGLLFVHLEHFCLLVKWLGVISMLCPRTNAILTVAGLACTTKVLFGMTTSSSTNICVMNEKTGEDFPGANIHDSGDESTFVSGASGANSENGAGFTGNTAPIPKFVGPSAPVPDTLGVTNFC